MKTIFPLYIGFLYLFCLVVYPQWYLPDASPCLRYFLAVCFLVLTLCGFSLAKCLVVPAFQFTSPNPFPCSENGKVRENLAGESYKLIVGMLCLITHLPFMNLPILTLGDCHMHAGLPALTLAKLDSLSLHKFGVSFRVIFFLCSGIFLILLHWRRYFIRFLSSTKGFSLVLFSGVVYVILLNQFSVLERFGKLEHFFRYPVLGKFLFFTGYTTFGVHEWVGRAIQIVFLFIGAIYFSKLLELLSDRRTAQAGYLIYLLFPPFWDFAHQNFLTAGVLFFSVSAIYYLVRYLKQGRTHDIYAAMAIIATGVTYKRFIIALVPISYIMAAVWLILKRKYSVNRVVAKLALLFSGRASSATTSRINHSTVLKTLKALSLASLFPIGLAIPDLFLFSHLRRLYPYYPRGPELGHIFSTQRLIESLSLIPSAMGWPLVFITILGLFLAVRYKRLALLICFSVWFIGYWLLISASDGYCYIRHNLIGYIPVAGFIAVSVGIIGKKLSLKLYYIFLPVPCSYLLFLSLYAGQGEIISLKRTKEVFLPYNKLFKFIKNEELYRHRIYAPMTCEPSHFYMAKYGLADTDFLFRKKWDSADFPYKKFSDFLLRENFHYIVIPEGPRVKGVIEEYIDEKLLSELLSDRVKYMKLYRTFEYGENTLRLFQSSQGENISSDSISINRATTADY